MKVGQIVVAVLIAILLPLTLIKTLNHQFHKPAVTKFTQSSLSKDVESLKIPKGLLGHLPKSWQKDLGESGKQAVKFQQKYVHPEFVKYEKVRFLTFAGLGGLIIIVLLLGRYPMFAWGLSVGSVATIAYAYIDTWSYLAMGIKWLLIPLLLILIVFFFLLWANRKK